VTVAVQNVDTPGVNPAAAPRAVSSGGRRRGAGLIGLAPFAVFVGFFLGLPTYKIVVGALHGPDGSWTLASVRQLAHDPYKDALVQTVKLSLYTALLGGALGLAIAFAVVSSTSTLLRHVVSTASGVLAYFGGVPLAFAFLATMGPQGLATRWLVHIGVHLERFQLYGFNGLTLVYLYFQIPLMVLVIYPALEGLRPQWFEAARNLGASRAQYWRFVGGPVLLPPVLGAVMLLFANSLAAYATARALTSGSIPLLSVQIANTLSSNVGPSQENLGYAMGLELIVIVALAMVGYSLLQRRAARWAG